MLETQQRRWLGSLPAQEVPAPGSGSEGAASTEPLPARLKRGSFRLSRRRAARERKRPSFAASDESGQNDSEAVEAPCQARRPRDVRHIAGGGRGEAVPFPFAKGKFWSLS